MQEEKKKQNKCAMESREFVQQRDVLCLYHKTKCLYIPLFGGSKKKEKEKVVRLLQVSTQVCVGSAAGALF